MIAFEVNPEVLRRLQNDPERRMFVDLWRDDESLKEWNKGYIEGNERFENSRWMVSKVADNGYRLFGTRFHSPASWDQVESPFETLELTVTFNPGEVEHSMVPETSGRVLSVHDRRLENRSEGVSGVEYLLNGEEWPSQESPALRELYMAEVERGRSKRRKTTVAIFAASTPVVMVLGASSIALFRRRFTSDSLRNR